MGSRFLISKITKLYLIYLLKQAETARFKFSSTKQEVSSQQLAVYRDRSVRKEGRGRRKKPT
jgi:hypothetical protein